MEKIENSIKQWEAMKQVVISTATYVQIPTLILL